MGHIAYVIDDELHRRAKALASRKGITFKAWVEQAIESEVDRQESEAEKRKR